MAIERAELQRTLAVLAFAVSIVINLYYLSGRGLPAGDDYPSSPAFRLDHTAFTPNVVFVVLFWTATYVSRIAYLHQLFAGPAESKEAAQRVVVPFITFDSLHFLWVLFLAHGHYVLAEIVVILNFATSVLQYLASRTTSLSPLAKWLTIHLGASAFPLAWTLFAVLWTGAVAVHSQSIFSRVLANILIWSLLVFPSLVLVLFADFSFGFASAFLTWGLAVSQVLDKVFGLQWIFAVIIAAIVTVESAILLFAGGAIRLGSRSAQAIDDVLQNVRVEDAQEREPLVVSEH
ncbi:hypothetical protein V1514DRAFT_335597 [Lipomyces japonicus]|uniref:uncharacterized protein n=1 Tax=Lipomyces japonicus TaxID=56871 RepID=UPI0034CE0109